MGEFGRSILTRPPEPVERGKVYEYDQRPGDLVIAMQEMTDRRGRRRRRRCVPLTRLSSGALSRGAEGQGDHPEAEGGRHYAVLLLFRGSRSRSELVATFMAVLELCRSRIIRLAGPAADCTVACREDSEE